MPKLYIIPNLIGDSPINRNLPDDVIKQICTLKYFIVEERKSANKLLKEAGVPTPFKDVVIEVADKTTVNSIIKDIVTDADGQDIGLLSEAGYPGIADPGTEVVKAAGKLGYDVVSFPGPSSIMMALAASGCQGQFFTFHGYLPSEENAREGQLKRLEQFANDGYTQIWIETPYRNSAMIRSIGQALSPETQVVLAVSLTTVDEKIIRNMAPNYKTFTEDLNRLPIVYLMHIPNSYHKQTGGKRLK